MAVTIPASNALNCSNLLQLARYRSMWASSPWCGPVQVTWHTFLDGRIQSEKPSNLLQKAGATLGSTRLTKECMETEQGLPVLWKTNELGC